MVQPLPLPASPLGIGPQVHAWRNACACVARLAEDDIALLVRDRREGAHSICDLDVSQILQSLAIRKEVREPPGWSRDSDISDFERWQI